MSRISGKRANFVWDPGSIGSNRTEDATFTMKGASLGDYVFVSANIDLENLNLYAHVEAKDTISIHLHNTTGGSKNLGEMRVNVTLVLEEVI